MKALIERAIQRRNPSFRFDSAITGGTLVEFLIHQAKSILRGWKTLLSLKNPRLMLRGKGVSFTGISKIQWGAFLKLGDYVALNSLGRQGITLGDHVGIGSYSRIIVSTSLNDIGSHIIIGNNVGIGEFAYLGGAGGLTIGDDCIVGQYFSCHPENHNFDDESILIRKQGVSRKGITIGSNCWIGSKVTVLDGVNIGSGCVIAAGSVITKSFPANSVIGGVPARLIKTRS